MTYNSNNSNYSYDFDTSVKSAEQEKKRPRRIYSTALINQLIKDRQQGYDIDYDPFYMRDLNLRAPGVTFRLTQEEDDEYQKCYDNPVYYVENYCKFMTDNGLDTVELRDFQKNVITTVTEETYIPENDDFGPKNRNVIWMASRQSGKCHLYSNEVEVQNELSGSEQEKIGEIYDKYIEDKTLIQKIKKVLYKLYNKL